MNTTDKESNENRGYIIAGPLSGQQQEEKKPVSRPANAGKGSQPQQDKQQQQQDKQKEQVTGPSGLVVPSPESQAHIPLAYYTPRS